MLGSVGIGVVDIQKTLKFFTEDLNIGLQPVMTFDVDLYYEIVLAFPPGTKHAGSAIILMEYKDKSLPKPVGQQGKMVFYVDDVKAVADRCKAAGNEMYVEQGASKDYPEMCMIWTPDRYVVELLPVSWAPWAASAAKSEEKTKI